METTNANLRNCLETGQRNEAAGVLLSGFSAEYLGHHDPGFTLRLYTHLLPSSHDRARWPSTVAWQGFSFG
jgi:hypothetical protein